MNSFPKKLHCTGSENAAVVFLLCVFKAKTVPPKYFLATGQRAQELQMEGTQYLSKYCGGFEEINGMTKEIKY